jgi:hypothetical protein
MGLNYRKLIGRRGPAAVMLSAMLVVAVGVDSASAANIFQRIFGGGKTSTANPPANALVIDPNDLTAPDYCPELRIEVGQQAFATFDPTHDGDQNYVRYLSSISQTARECLSVTDSGISMKIGVAGRVVAGPKGGTGKVTLPIRITVVKQSTNMVLFNKTFAETVAVTGGDLSTDFSQVINPVSFKRTALDDDLIVYIGFDQKKPT